MIKWLIGLLLFALSVPVMAQDDAGQWCVSVWYPSSEEPGGFDSIAANIDLVDVVNPFWYTPKADGSLIILPEAENDAQLSVLRDADRLIIPAIFSSISSMIEDETTRAAHVAHIVELVERMDYDGIDIDYEGFGRHTREPFALFVEELAAALHDNDRLLSVTVHPKTEDISPYDAAYAQDWQRIADAADILQIMTYDYTNRNEPPGPISPPEWMSDVIAYAATVTDLQNVRLGIPFYGYSWQRGTPPATTVSYQSIQRWVQSFDPEIVRDPAIMEMTIDLKVPGLPRQTISMNDAESVAYKIERVLADHPELGGVAIWGVGGEDPAVWDALREFDAACG